MYVCVGIALTAPITAHGSTRNDAGQRARQPANPGRGPGEGRRMAPARSWQLCLT